MPFTWYRVAAERCEIVRMFRTLLVGVIALVFTMGAYPPAKATVGVIGGVATTCGSLDIVVSGFTPGEAVLISLGNVNTSLIAGADGSGTLTIGVPNVAGSYTLVATGQTSGSVASSAVDLTTCAVDPAVPTTGATTTTNSSRGLPVSGSNVSTPARVALGFVALGLGLTAVGYRRRQFRRG